MDKATPNQRCLLTNASGQVVFTDVTDVLGGHPIVEEQKIFTAGTYAFSSGSQTGASNGGSCTFVGSTATATVPSSTGTPGSVTCIFVNTLAQGTVTVTKYLDYNSDGSRDADGLDNIVRELRRRSRAQRLDDLPRPGRLMARSTPVRRRPELRSPLDPAPRPSRV